MFDWIKNKTLRKGNDEVCSNKSFEDLFRLQRGPLLRFVNAKIKNEAEAEEIVQECFIRFQNKYDAETTGSPEALLARIAHNLLIDRVREKKARAAREDAWGKLHTDGAVDAIGGSESIDPARALSAKQQVEEALRVIEKLPDKTRQIFLLHRFEGLTHSEISEKTGIPKSTIEKHMIKAIKALSDLKKRAAP